MNSSLISDSIFFRRLLGSLKSNFESMVNIFSPHSLIFKETKSSHFEYFSNISNKLSIIFLGLDGIKELPFFSLQTRCVGVCKEINCVCSISPFSYSLGYYQINKSFKKEPN